MRKKLQLSPAEKELRKLTAKISRKGRKIERVKSEICKCELISERAKRRAGELKVILENHREERNQLEKELGKKEA